MSDYVSGVMRVVSSLTDHYGDGIGYKIIDTVLFDVVFNIRCEDLLCGILEELVILTDSYGNKLDLGTSLPKTNRHLGFVLGNTSYNRVIAKAQGITDESY